MHGADYLMIMTTEKTSQRGDNYQTKYSMRSDFLHVFHICVSHVNRLQTHQEGETEQLRTL